MNIFTVTVDYVAGLPSNWPYCAYSQKTLHCQLSHCASSQSECFVLLKLSNNKNLCCFMCTFPELCLSPFHSPTQKITRWCHGWGTSRTMCLAAGWMRPTWSPGTCTGLETWPPARCSGSTKPPRWDGAQLKDITRNASFPLVDLQQPHEESLCSPCIKDFNANCLGNYRVLWTLKASQTCQIICFLC